MSLQWGISGSGLRIHCQVGRINLIRLETRIIRHHFRRWLCVSIFIFFCGGLRKHTHVEPGRSRSSTVINFSANRKRVCNFLLVANISLGHILPRSQLRQVFCSEKWPRPHSNRILGVFQLDQIADVCTGPSQSFKLISCEIIFKLFQTMWSDYVNRTDR